MGLTKNGSRSPSEATPTARTARAPSETAPTPPIAAQAFQERELVFVPRSYQVTRRIRHLFCIAYPTVVFAILPLPERPRNALTSTLTLSGSFFEHLNGGWFRNRIALSCDLCSVLQRAFSLSARNALLFSLPSFLSCAAASHPAFFVTSADIPSLFSLNSAICASHLQQEKRLGCTPFHFELCFLRASLHDCRPPVLEVIAVCVSVPDLAMYPAQRCKKTSLCLFWSMSNHSMTEFLSDVFFSPPFCRYCAFLFPQSCCVSDISCSP